MYGYFCIKVHNNPNKETLKNKLVQDYFANGTKYYLNEKYDLDWLLYDYVDKPTNPRFKNFLNMILYYVKEDDTLVTRSIFQLGDAKVKIYNVLSKLRAKQVKLIVNEWNVDISSTMKMVLELSINDLAVYENVMLYKNHCSDYTVEENLYRKLIGYKLNENYIKNETNKIINRKGELK